MILRPLLPGPGPVIDPAAAESRARIAELYRPEPDCRVRVNMIATLNGSSIGADGTSESLSNRVDRAVLGVIRSQADVVVVGAASVRAEGYRVPRHVPLAVVSSSGDLRGHRLELGEGGRVLLLMPASRVEGAPPAPAGVEIVPVPDAHGRLDVADVLTALAARGLHRVVCEGGPSLTAQFAAADLVDELCLTTAPVVFLPGLPVLSPDGGGARLGFALHALAVDDAGFTYARWRRIRSDGPGAEQDPVV